MSRSIVFAVGLIAAFGFGSSALASNPPAVDHADQAQTASHQEAARIAKADRQGIKPGDRMCLQHTGSLIKPKPGKCIPAAGNSYSAEDIQRTGAMDTAGALQMLDPSIRIGH